jgi:hypothetical protein
MTARDLGAQATPRPWHVEVDAPDTAAEGVYIADGNALTVAAAYRPSSHADADFIVYAVNHIEAAEARLAEAERLLADFMQNRPHNDGVDEAGLRAWIERVRAFLAVAAGGGEG